MESNRREYTQSILFAVAFVLIFNIFFRLVVVSGISMEPTLKEGNVLMVSKLSTPKRGDIVVFYKEGSYLVKRVIAIEGDSMESKEGHIYVNGKDSGKGECIKAVVPEGKLFVVGDNRDHSYDSREFGFIDDYMGVVR